MTCVLDTNVVSALMHREEAVLDRLRRHRPREVLLVSPVAAEIRYGIERLPARSRRRMLLDAEYRRLRSLLGWSDWSEAAAEAFGRQKALLEASGQIIDDMDLAIGAVALALGAPLASRNRRHLGRIEGLVVEVW